MISQANAERFAADWVAAWNAHDLDRILEHYADDFEMSSPRIVQFIGEPSGKLNGKKAVGAYWQRALQMRPDLHFRLLDVFAGVDSVCIRYESLGGQPAVEIFEFDSALKVRRAAAHYAG
jgi:ketosteroid isomerase-like protein